MDMELDIVVLDTLLDFMESVMLKLHLKLMPSHSMDTWDMDIVD